MGYWSKEVCSFLERTDGLMNPYSYWLPWGVVTILKLALFSCELSSTVWIWRRFWIFIRLVSVRLNYPRDREPCWERMLRRYGLYNSVWNEIGTVSQMFFWLKWIYSILVLRVETDTDSWTVFGEVTYSWCYSKYSLTFTASGTCSSSIVSQPTIVSDGPLEYGILWIYYFVNFWFNLEFFFFYLFFIVKILKFSGRRALCLWLI